ncbi:MAG: hypothetical protein HY909_02230 [Deltaproteobacteria bacterium]|nr:hypothetical protein [Deltaproteobacteria bacterium]
MLADAGPPRVGLPACANPDDAPFRPDMMTAPAPGDGVPPSACRRVGAALTATPGEWPDAEGAPTPVVYLAPGSGAGSGTREDPYHDLTLALAARPAPGTVLLARGRHALAETVRVSAPVTLRGVGAGSDGTILVPRPGEGGLLVAPPGAGGLAVTVERLGVRYEATPTIMDSFGGVVAEGDTVTLTLRDVLVDGAGEGVRAGPRTFSDYSATLVAEGLTVRRSGRRGVYIDRGGHGYLRSVRVSDGQGVGILAERAHLVLLAAYVHDNVRDGVALRGVRTEPPPCMAGPTACPAAEPFPGFTHERRCLAELRTGGAFQCRSVDVLKDLVSLRNGVTALRAERTLPTEAEMEPALRRRVLLQPGPVVLAERLVLADTRVPAGTFGGDGLYLSATADFTLDAPLHSAAAAIPDMAMRDALFRGRGSFLGRNARVGVLVDGDRPGDPALATGSSADREVGARLGLAGTYIASNQGPGVFIQRRATVSTLSYVDAYDNGLLGVGVLGGSLVEVNCTTFHGTRAGVFTPENRDVRPYIVGDGANFSERSAADTTTVNFTRFDYNARFGAVFLSFDATLRGVRGEGNGFNAVAVRSMVDPVELAAIRGRTASSAPLVMVPNRPIEVTAR